MVPPAAATFAIPSAVSRQLAGSPAQVAFVCTPAVTIAAISTSASSSVVTAT